jgi:hypothetical protein
MPALVVLGATLRCTNGSVPGVLNLPATRGINAGGRTVARVTDTVAGVNIPSFGTCTATIGACTPALPGPWVPGSASVLGGNVPLLHQGCTCQCQRGGTLSILTPGQSTVIVG